MSDWYRRKTWGKTDEEEFFLKLGRARKESRPQYLKIQAIELTETRDTRLLDKAEYLLTKLLTEYPEDRFNRSSVLHTLGNIYQQRDNATKAIVFYKQAIDFEANYPNVKTQAYLDYSELVIKTNDTDSYEQVEKIILERVPELVFPLEKYKAFSILSIIRNFERDPGSAKRYADLADQYAKAETSGLQYHKYLGIVKERDPSLDKKVNQNLK